MGFNSIVSNFEVSSVHHHQRVALCWNKQNKHNYIRNWFVLFLPSIFLLLRSRFAFHLRCDTIHPVHVMYIFRNRFCCHHPTKKRTWVFTIHNSNSWQTKQKKLVRQCLQKLDVNDFISMLLIVTWRCEYLWAVNWLLRTPVLICLFR